MRYTVEINDPAQKRYLEEKILPALEADKYDYRVEYLEEAVAKPKKTTKK
jgi:hypothetical protein